MKNKNIILCIVMIAMVVIQSYADQWIEVPPYLNNTISKKEQLHGIQLFNNVITTYNAWHDKFVKLIPIKYQKEYFSIDGIIIGKIKNISNDYSKNIDRKMYDAIVIYNNIIIGLEKDATRPIIKEILKREELLKDIGNAAKDYYTGIYMMREYIIKK